MSDSAKPDPQAAPAPASPESLSSLDLRFLPSWLKEENSSPANYANFDGEDRAPRRDRRDGGNDSQRGGRPKPPGGRGDNRGNNRPPARPGGSGGSVGDASRPAPREGRPPENRGPRRPDSARPDDRGRRSGPPDRRQEQRPPQPEERPAKVSVSFLPEQHALEKVTEQLKSAPIAYPLFGVAKMFLQRPERHQVVIKALPEAKLYQLQHTAHFSTEKSRLEAMAFQELGSQFFRIETTEAPEIKGNFASVARSRLTGKVFGPTSHHSFQPALHKEYEERFSRRMSFQEYRGNIETTNNPEAIEQWKTESRRVETYHLLTPAEPIAASAPVEEAAAVIQTETAAGENVSTETVIDTTELSAEMPPAEVIVESAADSEENTPTGEPLSEDLPPATETMETVEQGEGASPAAAASASQTFASKAEAEAYFRQEILPALITETASATLTGPEARALTDRRLTASVRQAWEAEMRYPLGLVNGIRVKFNEQNLHIFKFKKRVLLISSLKPFYLDDKSESLSGSIRRVLQTIGAEAGIDRKGLAEKILGNSAAATESEKLTLKQSLIGDLYWLIRQGHVIEFSDGTFDLPMGPRAVQAEAAQEAKASAAPAEASPAPQEQ